VKDASEYLVRIKAQIVAHTSVEHWEILREEAQGEMGLIRYRLILRSGELLEVFERFQILRGRAEIEKYSYHWQDEKGNLKKRWDNAAHHPEVKTYPHHVHEGKEDKVKAHGPMSIKKVLSAVASEFK
jgi:hypothetical protein